ncbi:MAG: HD domain-containing protein [Spirochaetes bacterium]|nr:HD domain-containing protein [Spirochaetota bacterium]
MNTELAGDFSLEQFKCISSVFNSFGDFLIVYDAEGTIFTVNEQLAVTLDYSEDELRLMNIDSIFKPADGLSIKSNFDYLEKTDRKEFRGVFCRRNGQKLPVKSKITKLFLSGNPVIMSISQDITTDLYIENEKNEKFRLLRENLGGIIMAIANAVEARDAYTAGHQQRVSNIARKIAEEMNLHPDKIEGIRIAASIHDIGKIAIPTDILNKSNTLLDLEFELIKHHTNIGFHILSTIEFPWPIAAIVFQHHEKIDGTGYPLGLEEDMILIESKIVTVADVVEAMSTHRPYRPAVGTDSAIEMINRYKGVLFDRQVVETCTALYNTGEISFDNSQISKMNMNRRYF